jgi:protein-tyrosine-phosphatase
MMQAVLQQQLGPAFRVESAGVQPGLAGRPANHRAVTCVAERGIDLGGHVSRWIGSLDLTQYAWIVCVGSDEADRVLAMPGAGSARVIVANAEGGGIPDPYEHDLARYRACLALLDQVLPAIAAQIRR